jgi:uracil phosphoribosyltransferase
MLTLVGQQTYGLTDVLTARLCSGESMENALRACCKGIKIGKILIHREGDNGKQLIYDKLPRCAGRTLWIMLARS